MKIEGEKWSVAQCGNPDHGPSWHCWKVKDSEGMTVLSNVTKSVAEMHAAVPDLVRALLQSLADTSAP